MGEGNIGHYLFVFLIWSALLLSPCNSPPSVTHCESLQLHLLFLTRKYGKEQEDRKSVV